jgi:hypothetical protein
MKINRLISKAITVIVALFLFKLLLIPMQKEIIFLQKENPLMFVSITVFFCLIVAISSVAVGELLSNIKKDEN